MTVLAWPVCTGLPKGRNFESAHLAFTLLCKLTGLNLSIRISWLASLLIT